MEVQLTLNEEGYGAFYLVEGSNRLGEMEVEISGNTLTVYHTEVVAKAEGKGLAKKMLEAMVKYAREKKLKVVPLCPYVHAQFKRHANEYADIWNNQTQV